MRTCDVVVAGAGVVGLACAWRLAEAGASVVVADPAPLSGASAAAAGMLAPATEAHYGEAPLTRLCRVAAAAYPAFVADLSAAGGGPDVGYRRCGTLSVAMDAGDRAVLADLHGYQLALGLSAQRLTARGCRELEPLLSPDVHGGLLVADDHQVDNRLLGAALLAAATAGGAAVVRCAVVRVRVADDRVRGVELDGGEELAAPTVVVAAGCRSAGLAGVPDGVLPPVRPVKGQILRLRGPADHPVLTRTVRAIVAGNPVYLVPRASGELVVGATVEEMGFDTTVRAGAVYELLRDAHTLVPATRELELVETLAGLRPGTPDNLPVVGATRLPGLVAAYGHYRNGILLAPVTADAVTALVSAGSAGEEWAAFAPARFDPVAAAG